MPAKHSYRINDEGIYCHIYNQGIDGKNLFKDDSDYKTFIDYLKEYLTPATPENNKTVFTVNGRTFRGIPHQPKNYFNKVELIAYSLTPTRFHLLLHQKNNDSIERLMRSLSTRYSIYFNKKYHRTGTLFEGPYKSVHIKDESQLPLLTRYFHKDLANKYSSYPEYLGKRSNSWVKPKTDSIDKSGNYQSFIENYELNQKEKDILNTFIPNFIPKKNPEPKSYVLPYKPLPRIPELIITSTIFLLLLSVGLRNIRASSTKTPHPSPAPQGPQVEAAETLKPQIVVVVQIDDKSESINIRQGPSVRSAKIGKAANGDTFDFVSVDSEWYEVRLGDGTTGFISSTYARLEEITR